MTDTFIFDDFTIDLPLAEVTARLKLTDEDDVLFIQEKLNTALEIARPKAICRICSVDEITGAEVFIEGHRFASDVLAKNLEDKHRVFAYVITCGLEVDAWSHREEDPVAAFWLDIIKEMILGKAIQQFYAHLKNTYGFQKTASMSPGSGNLDVWPIAQQKELFALLGDVQANIGVTLTDSFLMLPTKSVSGVMFPSEVDFVTCSLCSRAKCPNRRAPQKNDTQPPERDA